MTSRPRSARPRRRASAGAARLALATLLAPAALGACGWRAGLPPPVGVRSVGLVVFDNETPEPDLEPRLSARLTDAVQRFVDADLVRPERADAVVRGTLVEFRRRMGVRSEDNRLLETGTMLVVEAQLVHRESGIALRTAEHRVWSDYALGDRDADARAVDRALEHLAERLVLDLFRPPAYEDVASGPP